MSILISWLGPLRAICMAIDGIAYSLLDQAYNLVIKLSTAELFQHETIRSITNNLYILIGVVAFFRLALVLVNAIIDPEKLNEKGKGLSNIFFRVVGMIILLAVTPFLFQLSYDVQKRIVGADPDQNIIFKTLLGDKANISGENAGKALQNIAISSLITIDQNYLKADGKTCESEDDSDCGFVPLTCVSNGDGTCTNQGGYIFGDECSWDNCQKAVAAYNEMYVNENMSPSELSKWAGVSKTIKDENGDKQEIYVYNYMFLITTFVGGFMTYIIISFAIDIAVRMFELLVLEVLSPLFIATFVDPKSAQSGPFKNWLNAVGKSYISLYIKLAILALLVLLVSIINQSKIFTAMSDLGGWVKIFAIVGLLIFAKKAPKWIGDIIGIKGDDGLGGLSIGKKLGAMALAGGLAAKGLEKAKQGLGKGARALGGSALGSLGATSAARRIMRDKQKSQGSLKDIYKNARDNGKSKKQALGSYFNEGAKRMKDRAKAGIEGGKYGSREGLQAGVNTKNAAEMAGLLGKTYSNMTKEAGHNGIKDKISAKFEDSTANAKIKAFGVSNSEELRKLSENAEKIRKANKYRAEPIKLNSNGEREAFDFQNGIEMNKAIKLACDKGVGFNLDHDPTSANEVYMADMINNGLATKVTMDSNGNITSFVDKSGNTILGADVSKALEAYGNSKFTMAGRDQILLDCANNISSTQEALITAKAKVKELEMQSSDLNVNLAKLNMDRSSVVNNVDMTNTMKVALTDSTGKVGNVEMTIADAYKYYQEATDSKVKSEYEDALKKVIPDQFTALKSIDTSIMDVNNQKKKLDDAVRAWNSEKEERENILVKVCENFVSSPKDNPMANPDNVTLVGSYEKDSSGNVKFVRDSDKSKVYSVDVARQNTQVKIGKLEEKAKASYNSGKESGESK